MSAPAKVIRRAQAGTTESPWVKWTLIAIALAFMFLFLVLPLAAVATEALRKGFGAYLEALKEPDAWSAIELTLIVAAITVPLNLVFGVAAAWAIAKFEFRGKSLLTTLVDLPFALPTAVAGIALTALYSNNGWIGQWLPFKVSFTPLGVFVALTFIGLPFVVRTLQPVLEDLPGEVEEAAAMLGASRAQTFVRVILPAIAPALLTGFALAFARALGEYGSVIFIAGNLPLVSEITPLIIITKLEQYDYTGATAIAVVMLVASFAMLLAINALQAWTRSRQGR